MKYIRLKKQADFQKLFGRGKRAFSPSLTLLYRPSDSLKMGISIGKKHGKAVKRNRIKRLLREAFRLETDGFQGKYAIILVPKVAEEYSLQTYREHIRWILKKEKL
jgi:ribonuclease P protein component